MSDFLRDAALAPPSGPETTIDFEGARLPARAGEPVAVSLLAAGTLTLARSPKFHRPRGAFCLDGHCGSCALRIDGHPNIRSCLALVHDGLACSRQNAFPTATLDFLGAADWVFPDRMDHHRLMTGNRLANELFVKVVRQMGGAGRLPDRAPTDLPPIREELVDIAVVGGGPAGLAAARAAALAAPQARVALFDEQSAPGGSLLAEPAGLARGRAMADAAAQAGARIQLDAPVLAYYPEDTGPAGSARPKGILAVATPTGLLRLQARRVVYATGAYDQNLPFVDNDRPGIMSARAVGRLAFRWGVRPRRVVILLAAPLGQRLADHLSAAGIPVEVVDTDAELVLRARGARRVTGVEVSGTNQKGGYTRVAHGDLLAVATLPAPASDLPRQHGAHVAFDLALGGFAVTVDAHFLARAPDVFAAGDVTGYRGPELAAQDGAAAGRAAAEGLT